jgi:hypothetical protein
MVMKQPKVKQVFPEKNWGSIKSLHALEKLNPQGKEDLCVIFIDAKGNEPEVLRVSGDVFQNKSGLSIDFGKIFDLKATLGTLLVKSDPEFMNCLRQSQIEKKTGNYRKFEDIARECGL